jgi:hypothetical protein
VQGDIGIGSGLHLKQHVQRQLPGRRGGRRP